MIPCINQYNPANYSIKFNRMVAEAKICASIVVFHPNLDHLQDLLTRIRPQVDAIVIYENTEENSIQRWITEHFHDAGIELKRCEQNVGICAAHNSNIQWALAYDFTHILLLDDDSLPGKTMVRRMLRAWHRLKNQQLKVAAVGPSFFSMESSEPYFFIRLEGFRFNRVYCRDICDGCPPVDYLISSGSLMELSIFETVGLFDPSMFMDYFDIEWCLRAKHLGYQCFAVYDAQLHHRLGEGNVTFMGHTTSVHSPLRHYYIFRNMLSLYRRPFVSWKWKVADSYRIPLRAVFYSCACTPRWQHLRMITLGLWHGLIGRSGKYF